MRRMAQRSERFGAVDEGAGGLVWVAFALCGESFVEDGHRKEEEDASVDDNGGDKARSVICPWEAMWVSAY
jgi:hypothetical protein